MGTSKNRTSADLLRFFDPSEGEKKAIEEAVELYILRDLASSTQGWARGCGVMKQAGATPDDVLSVAPGDYKKNHRRYHQLVEIVFSKAQELQENFLPQTKFQDRAKAARASYEEEVEGNKVARDLVIMEANRRITEAKRAYGEATKGPRAKYDKRLARGLKEALSQGA